MKQLQNLLDRQIGKGHIHNLVVAIQSYDRSLDFIGAAGYSDPETETKMTPDTPFFIASVTKMYTAAIILKLEQEKRIDLQAPISKYLPPSLIQGIHIFRGTDYSDRIKIIHLLNQTSGLADYEAEKPRGGKSILEELKTGRDQAVSTLMALEIVRRLTPKFPPGPNKAHYSNTNYRLLGVIIETVTGKSMAENLQERIFLPLGLRHTYLYDQSVPRPEKSPATIFLKKKAARVPQYMSSNTSDGGLVSTASECLNFLRAFFEGRLFDEKYLGQMMNWNPLFFPLRYGWGLMYFRLPRFFWPGPLPEFIGHSGSTGSFAFFCPRESIYLAGTINQIASPPRPFFFMISLLRAARVLNK